MVVDASNPNIEKAEVGGSGVQGHLLLCREFKASLVFMRPCLEIDT